MRNEYVPRNLSIYAIYKLHCAIRQSLDCMPIYRIARLPAQLQSQLIDWAGRIYRLVCSQTTNTYTLVHYRTYTLSYVLITAKCIGDTMLGITVTSSILSLTVGGEFLTLQLLLYPNLYAGGNL